MIIGTSNKFETTDQNSSMMDSTRIPVTSDFADKKYTYLHISSKQVVSLDMVDYRTFICPRKKKSEFYEEVERTQTTSDLVVVHTLICSR